MVRVLPLLDGAIAAHSTDIEATQSTKLPDILLECRNKLQYCAETMDCMRSDVESLPGTGPIIHPGERGAPGCAALDTTAQGVRVTAAHIALHRRDSGP